MYIGSMPATIFSANPHPGIQFNTRQTGAQFSTRSESEFIPCL